MKKTIVVFLIILCAFIVFGRPALAAVIEDDRVAFVSLEPVTFALPGDVFVVSFLPLTFVPEYFEQGQIARCLEGYFLTSRERPPPLIS